MVASLCNAQAIGTLVGLIVPAIAPAIAEGYGIPVYLIGYQASLFYTGMVLSMLFGSNLILRWGGCRASQFGLLLTAAGALLITSGSVALLIPASLAMGLGYGILTPASSHILLRFTPAERRNLVFSMKQSGVPLGVIAAGTAGPAITLAFGWQWALVAVAALAVLASAALQIGRRRLDDDRIASTRILSAPLASFHVMWSRRSLRLLALGGAMLATSQVIVHNYTVTMFYEELHLPLVQAGLMLTIAQIGGFIGRLVWGWIADRSGDCLRVMAIIAGLLAAATLAITTLRWGWPMPAIYALFFVLGASSSGYHGAFLAEIARLSPPGQAGAGTAGTMIVTNSSAIITPIIFANVFVASQSYALTFGMLCIPAVAAIFLLRSARRAQTST